MESAGDIEAWTAGHKGILTGGIGQVNGLVMLGNNVPKDHKDIPVTV